MCTWPSAVKWVPPHPPIDYGPDDDDQDAEDDHDRDKDHDDDVPFFPIGASDMGSASPKAGAWW